MPNRKTKPTSPGRRFGTYQLREELSGARPEKSLMKGKKRSSGRGRMYLGIPFHTQM